MHTHLQLAPAGSSGQSCASPLTPAGAAAAQRARGTPRRPVASRRPREHREPSAQRRVGPSSASRRCRRRRSRAQLNGRHVVWLGLLVVPASLALAPSCMRVLECCVVRVLCAASAACACAVCDALLAGACVRVHVRVLCVSASPPPTSAPPARSPRAPPPSQPCCQPANALADAATAVSTVSTATFAAAAFAAAARPRCHRRSPPPPKAVPCPHRGRPRPRHHRRRRHTAQPPSRLPPRWPPPSPLTPLLLPSPPALRELGAAAALAAAGQLLPSATLHITGRL